MNSVDPRIAYLFSYLLVSIACAGAGTAILAQVVNEVGRGSEREAFKRFTVSMIVFSLSNGVNAMCNVNGWPHIGTVFSAINLISIMVCAYEWFKYIEFNLELVDRSKQLSSTFARIPLLIGIALVVTTPFTKLVFYYDENGMYRRGILYLLIMGLLWFYGVYATVHVFACISKAGTASRRRQYYVFMSFIIFPIAGGAIDAVVPHVPVMELMMLLALVTVFTNLQQSQIYIDSLTGINNRRMAGDHLLKKIATASEEEPFYFFMCDVDSFKRINDRFGHNVGDRALNVVANVMRDFGKKHDCQIARWGGDEFSIIADASSVPSPDKVADELNEALVKAVEEENAIYELKVSVGYSTCSSIYREPVDIVKEADNMMYLNKPSVR